MRRDLIHSVYLEGDFDQAIAALDKAMANDLLCTSEDSVFTFKHLGVMMAAREGTRERGKYYLLQLIKIDTAANIFDMYASDQIYQMFMNVKKEFESARAKPAAAKAGGTPADGTRPGDVPGSAGVTALTAPSSVPSGTVPPDRESGKPKNWKTWAWVGGGGTALLGLGLGFYILESQSPPRPVRFSVD